MDQLFDRYVLFVSADFFLDYWVLLSGRAFSPSGVSAIQAAGRTTVEDFMRGEETYWDIDFSLERHRDSRALFQRTTGMLSKVDQPAEETMRRAFCEDEQERLSTSFALSFLHRITKDQEYCVDAGVRSGDADVVGACLARVTEEAVDLAQVEEGWLNSPSEWDQRLRGFTPDLESYIADSFIEVYRKVAALPAFVANLSNLLPADERLAVLKRLNESLEQQFPKESGLAVPLALRV